MTLACERSEGQFVVSTRQRELPEGWNRKRLDGVFLDTSPETNLIPVEDPAGQSLGILVGNPIDLDNAKIVSDIFKTHERFKNRKIDEFVEKNILKLAGSFIFIFVCDKDRRIYLDSNGTYSLVYDARRFVAGSTAGVILTPGEYQERFRKDLYDRLDVRNSGWFTAGLTAHREIDRLTCNHCLNLDSWEARRHWPTTEMNGSLDAGEYYERICNRVTRTIRVLASAGPVGVALTAGIDLRLLLACCRDLIRDVSFITVDAPGHDIDVQCARRLAERFGLHHEILPFRRATEEQAELWRLRAGHCVGGHNVGIHPSVAPLEGRYFVGGLGGEVGRGFLWLNADRDTPLDAAGLVARLKLPQEPEVLRRVEQWLRPLSHLDTISKLDLAYIELRMCSWGFSDTYVKPAQNEIHPLISRENYEDMLSVPAEMRKNGTVIREAIRQKWPEILEYPINRYGTSKDFLVPLLRAIKNPDKAYKKAVQVLKVRLNAL